MAIGRVFKLTAPEGTVELMTKGVGSTTDYNDDCDLDEDDARDEDYDDSKQLAYLD